MPKMAEINDAQQFMHTNENRPRESKFLRFGEILSKMRINNRVRENYLQTSVAGIANVCKTFQTSGIPAQTFATRSILLLTFTGFSEMKNPPFGGFGNALFVAAQKLYIALSSASISRDRFLSPSRYCGVKTSVLDSCSSFSTTDWRELFKRVSILWTLFRSRVKSSIAIVASHTGGLWSGLRSWSHTARPDFFFKGSCDTWQEKSELPKNYESCPINRPKPLVIGQSQFCNFV
jgi:hypothetical protein